MPAGPRTVKVDSRSGAITDHRVPRPHALNLPSEWSASLQRGGLCTSGLCTAGSGLVTRHGPAMSLSRSNECE